MKIHNVAGFGALDAISRAKQVPQSVMSGLGKLGDRVVAKLDTASDAVSGQMKKLLAKLSIMGSGPKTPVGEWRRPVPSNAELRAAVDAHLKGMGYQSPKGFAHVIEPPVNGHFDATKATGGDAAGQPRSRVGPLVPPRPASLRGFTSSTPELGPATKPVGPPVPPRPASPRGLINSTPEPGPATKPVGPPVPPRPASLRGLINSTSEPGPVAGHNTSSVAKPKVARRATKPTPDTRPVTEKIAAFNKKVTDLNQQTADAINVISRQRMVLVGTQASLERQAKSTGNPGLQRKLLAVNAHLNVLDNQQAALRREIDALNHSKIMLHADSAIAMAQGVLDKTSGDRKKMSAVLPNGKPRPAPRKS